MKVIIVILLIAGSIYLNAQEIDLLGKWKVTLLSALIADGDVMKSATQKDLENANRDIGVYEFKTDIALVNGNVVLWKWNKEASIFTITSSDGPRVSYYYAIIDERQIVCNFLDESNTNTALILYLSKEE